jgi:hypothetical protein
MACPAYRKTTRSSKRPNSSEAGWARGFGEAGTFGDLVYALPADAIKLDTDLVDADEGDSYTHDWRLD